MKILVSGGGIAGNALAFWLVRLGHDVTIVERFPSLRATGLQIDLRRDGISVLKKMGLEAAFKAKSPPEQGLGIVNGSGKRIAYFPANRSGKGLQSFTTDYEIMRGDFCRLMHDSTKDRAKYLFGTTITELVNNEKSVKVTFANGTVDTFDLVVGADGVGSRTRALIGMDGFHPCKGQFAAYMTLPSPIADGETYDATMYMAPSRGVMVRRHSPDYLQIYLFCTTDEPDIAKSKRGSPEEKASFRKVMRGAGWRTDEFLNRFDDMPDFYCERLGLVKLESWSSGRVVLLGDAAYCPSANTGMGTTSAIVGAYVLAGEISKCGEHDLPAALKEYERKVRPFMEQVQAGVLEQGATFPSSRLGIVLMNTAMSLASFFKIDVFGRYLLKEDVKNWDLPEYEALKVV
jgi:2-polyprenyl-6-methoxyphenol hydroxylase-like FAD-dependent oxidoreductase